MPRVTITVPGKTPQPYRFQLDRESVTLGRGSENDIAIDCGSVSVKHAEMRRISGGYELRDLGSTNGIKSGDERRIVIPLHNGLPVTLGDVEFDFLLTDEELETLSHEQPQSEEHIPLPPLKEEPRQRPVRELQTSGGSGFGSFVLFLILAAVAFAAGLAMRFQKETGGSLVEAIKAKNAAVEAPANPAPEPAE